MNTPRKGFAVVWCDRCPTCSSGDLDLDRAHYTQELFATEAEAATRARQLESVDMFGDPAVYHFWTEAENYEGILVDEVVLGDYVELEEEGGVSQ